MGTRQKEEYPPGHRCDILQGYLFSRPLPEQEALEFLISHDESKE